MDKKSYPDSAPPPYTPEDATRASLGANMVPGPYPQPAPMNPVSQPYQPQGDFIRPQHFPAYQTQRPQYPVTPNYQGQFPMYTQQNFPMPPDPNTVYFVQGVEFDAYARVDAQCPPRIPPPPPGVMPNTAQILASQGCNVQIQKSRHKTGGGYVFW